MSGALGGGKSSSTTNPDTVWGAQAPYLEQLYGGAADQLAQQQGTQFSQQFQDPSLQAFQQQAGGGAAGGINQQALAQMAQGGQYDQFMNQQNPALQGAIQSGLGQINRNFQRNIMPAISQGAVGAGTSGGSRQGIAQGLAMSDANQQASDFVNQMQSENFNQMQQRNLAATGAGLQNQLGAYGQMGQLAGQQDAAAQGAMGLAPQLSNLGFNTQYGNLANFGQLIGKPTVLGGGGGSKSWNLSASGGLF